MLLLFVMMVFLVVGKGGTNKTDVGKEDVKTENGSENKNHNKRIIHDNNDPDDIDIKIDTDIDMITVHTADHQLSINLLGECCSWHCLLTILNCGDLGLTSASCW